MLKLLIFLVLVCNILAAPSQNQRQLSDKATDCDESKCVLPDCRCSSTKPPAGLELSQIPQFVFLTFDDAVTALFYDTYKDLFYNRTNPDGCPVGATYFMSHEYTDYSKVHDLYLNGQGIALHSVTHTALTTYWKDISLDDLRHEFGDEKKMVAHWAQIPDDGIEGMRLPFLQLSGNNTFQVGKELGLQYDCSWPTQSFMDPPLWPYTLDYLSTQDCPIGPCPNAAIPDFWVVPMVDWKDQKNIVCSMVDACVNIPTDEEGVFEWYLENFNRHYKNNRAPFGFYVHAAWFSVDASHLPAYKRFVDYLQSLSDVYIVPISRAIEWIKNPVAIGSADWPKCAEPKDLGCTVQTCPLKKDQETLYMTVCADECPDVYPWLNNPYGEDDS